jgi:phosphopantothenoylcysteine decarboxylase/phosphopantothenate--cysteine ligase
MDLIVMTAAVSDYRPEVVHPQKVKKANGPEAITFVRTPDILAGLGERFVSSKPRPFLVGFAAETEQVVAHARAKLASKKCDLVVANYVGQGGAFGAADNEVTVVSADAEVPLARAGKDVIAGKVLDEVVRRLGR